jgi:hypothetical protein
VGVSEYLKSRQLKTKEREEMKVREKNQETRFACTCNGCRNYPTNPAQIWHHDQIASKTNGYFFSPQTMRYFSSRISDFKPLEDNGLAVIISNRFEPSDPRHYEIVTICKYGEVNRIKSNNPNDWAFKKYDSLKQARKAWQDIAYPITCDCHGCQLDREDI